MIFATKNNVELYYFIATVQTTSHVTISKPHKPLDFQEANAISTDTRQKKKEDKKMVMVKTRKSQQNQTNESIKLLSQQ